MPEIWELDNHIAAADMKGCIKDKGTNTVILLLETQNQHEAKWAYIFYFFFASASFDVPKIFLPVLRGTELMLDQPDTKGIHMF